MWDEARIVAITTAVTVPVTSLLTLLLTKGRDTYLAIRKAKTEEVMEEKKFEAGQEVIAFQQATAAYEKLTTSFEARVKTLETALASVNDELKEARKEHVNCVREQERLRGELKALQVHVDRLWSHDTKNKEYAEKLKAETEAKAEELKASAEATAEKLKAETEAKIEEIKQAVGLPPLK